MALGAVSLFDPGDAPTPRESTAAERARVFSALARDLARQADRVADDAMHAGRPEPRARLLAGRALAMAEAFDAWTRGTATLEHRAEDMARWRDLLAAARELGVG